ncbi:MAG: hypothetical protein JO080_04495, partial [Mucilaginibacter sp.]|nr:hypothetical protein [Mucilaginibacter sp.]
MILRLSARSDFGEGYDRYFLRVVYRGLKCVLGGAGFKQILAFREWKFAGDFGNLPETFERKTDEEWLAISSPGYLLLGDRKKENRRQNNDGADPKTSGHFVHVTKKKEGQNDAIHRLE